jgi:hypothetical protein
MKIEYVRSGGLAGLRQSYSASSDALSADEQSQLSQLIEDSRFFDQPEMIGTGGSGADRFQYRISVEDDGRSHTVQVGEDAVPAELRPLISWLANASRRH